MLPPADAAAVAMAGEPGKGFRGQEGEAYGFPVCRELGSVFVVTGSLTLHFSCEKSETVVVA